MKTKAQIVQELLEKQAINAEDAVVLLTKEVEIQYVNWGVYPAYPAPYQPIWKVYPEYLPSYTTGDNIMFNNCTN